MNYIEIIGGLLGGGGLITLFNYFRDSKKDRSEEIFKVLDEYKEMVVSLRNTEAMCKQELKKHEDRINELMHMLQELRSQFILLESASNDLPFPMWLKDVNSKMLFVNVEYEKTFLVPMGKKASDYIGSFDYDIWSKEVADSYVASDKKTLKLKGQSSIITGDIIIIDGKDLSEEWVVIKFLRYVGASVVGIGGIAIPTFNKIK